MNKKTGKRRPTSPGHIIRLDYLNTLNMGVRSFARHMGVSRLTALALLDGRIAIDARLAIRLSVVFNTTSDLWLGLQHAIDIWDVNNTKETIIAAMGHQPTAYKKAEFISVPTHLPIVTATPNVNSKHVEHNTIHDNQCLVPLENFYVGSDLNDKFIDDKLTIKDLAKIVNHINIILSQKPEVGYVNRSFVTDEFTPELILNSYFRIDLEKVICKITKAMVVDGKIILAIADGYCGIDIREVNKIFIMYTGAFQTGMSKQKYLNEFLYSKDFIRFLY